MGLDMMFYKKNERENEDRDVAFWRKMPSIHEWFRQLGIKKGIDGCKDPDEFNGIEVPITKEDITNLTNDLCTKNINYDVEGFFFGSDSEMNDVQFARYMEYNFEQIVSILEELDDGKELYYTSWW